MITLIKIFLAADFLISLFLVFSSSFKKKRFLWIKKEIFGLILLAGGIVESYALYTENWKLLQMAFWCFVGISAVFLAVFDLIKIHMCKTAVYGKFIESKTSGTGRNRGVTPTFEYTFEGVVYKNESGERIPTEMAKDYENGKPYPIFICQKEPYLYITDRKMSGRIIFEIIMGLVVIGSALIFHK